MASSLDERIQTLQLLAQRQNLTDVTSKADVGFKIEGSTFLVYVKMMSTAGEKSISMVAEYKAGGKSFEEALQNLLTKLVEPLRVRTADDIYVIAQCERALNGKEVKTTPVNDFQPPVVR